MTTRKELAATVEARDAAADAMVRSCAEQAALTATAPLRLVVGPGPRNAHTDPKTGLRFYGWQGRDLPSVTSIRRLAGVPFGLHQWAITQVIDHVIDHVGGLAMMVAQNKPEMLAMVRHELRGAATAKRDAAADLGTAVHDAAAGGKALTEVPPEVAPRLRAYLEWLALSRAEIVASEYQVWNLDIGYAGTTDALVRFPNGDLYVVDYKTGRLTYPEYLLQVIAYFNGEFVGNDDVVDERLTALHRSAIGVAILHLGDAGWEFIRLRVDPDDWAAFRGLLTFATWMAAHPTLDDQLVIARRKSEPA